MPVPFEAALPFGIIIAMFVVTGGLLTAVKQYRNEGYTPRYSLDRWDKQMMERDRRLTGSLRKQSDAPRAVSSPPPPRDER